MINLNFSKIIKLALLIFIAVILILLLVHYTLNPKGFLNMNFFFDKEELIEISNEKFSPSGIENVYVKASGTGCSVEIFYTDSPDFNAVLRSSDPDRLNPLDITADGSSVKVTVTQPMVIGIFINFRTVLDLYIPRSYAENLYISTSSGSFRTSERLAVKNLSIETASGSIRAEEISSAGSLKLSTSSGSHHIGDISADFADLSAASGSITIRNTKTNGNFTIHTSSGTIRTENISAGDVKLSAASGSINIQNVESTGSFSAETSSGTIRTGDVTADSAHCSSTSGSLHLGIVTAPMRFTSKSSSGSTKIDSVIASSVECTGTSGSIKIGYAEGNLSLSTSSGGITVDTIKGCGRFKTTSASIKTSFSSVTGDLELQASSGSITVSLPRDVSVQGSFHTSSGSFKSDFDFNKLDRSNYEFTTGGGNHKLTATTSSGGIRVETN